MATRRPTVTKLILEGLTEAYTRMESDDLTDLEEDRARHFEAAGKWIKEMWQHVSREEKSDHCTIDRIDCQ